MAGHVLKIMMEYTHPPVWRRVVVPERITFLELHKIIQILFGWSDCHLHEFRIPSKDICIDGGEESWSRRHYREEETLVEQFLLSNKWVRYTYDFGDDWRHKIFYEKTDESYDKRYASLLKAKGDNFPEDSGGVWGACEEAWDESSFHKEQVAQKLEQLICPIHEENTEMEEAEITEAEMEQMVKDFFQRLPKIAYGKEEHSSKKPSQMAKKVLQWRDFVENDDMEKDKIEAETEDYTQLSLPFLEKEEADQAGAATGSAGNTLELLSGEKTVGELLRALSLKEAEDYCKYLQIPRKDSWTKNQMTDAVAQTFQKHPEYLLYVLYEEEYKEFVRWRKLPRGITKERPVEKTTWIKAISLGLVDLSVQKTSNGSRGKLSFAKDIADILKPLHADIRKQTYRNLKRFSNQLQNLILVYGLMDFDSLYEIFCQVYHETMDKEAFCRYIYWFARFNDLVQTAYSLDGKSYVSAMQLDMRTVLNDMIRYAGDMDYVVFSAPQLKKMAEDISARSDWVDMLFATLHFQFQLSEEQAVWILENVFTSIVNGSSEKAVLDKIFAMLPNKQWDLREMCQLWECVISLLLELELPMLKGRSRNQYGEETGISPWQIGMLEEENGYSNTKVRHMSQFPVEIQEAMYQACGFVTKQDRNMLFRYQEKEKIKSEEYLYLLAEAHITACEFSKASKLLGKLEKSSDRGKNAAAFLRLRLETGQDVMDEDF